MTSISRIVLLGCAFMVCSQAALATGTTTIHKVVNIAPGGFLYVYKAPNIKSAVVKKLKKNDLVLINDYTYGGGVCINGKTGKDYTGNLPAPNVFCEVYGKKMGGKVGFAYTRYLKFVEIY